MTTLNALMPGHNKKAYRLTRDSISCLFIYLHKFIMTLMIVSSVLSTFSSLIKLVYQRPDVLNFLSEVLIVFFG